MKTKKRILFVEDSPVVRAQFKDLFENEFGFDLIEQPNGNQAIQFLNKTPEIDAAILDIMMIGHGGSVRNVLKSHPVYHKIPIIYHTSLDREQIDPNILDGSKYFSKSVKSPKEIINYLKTIFDKE